MKLWHTLQAVIAASGGWLGWFLGGWDGFIFALVTFMVIDYITGIMCAIVNKNLSSSIGAKGIFKKIFIFALVGVGHTIDTYLIGYGSAIRTAAIFFFLSNEGISLLENTIQVGLPVPQKMKDILTQLHKKDGWE
jgi:toxin secretion/phage lysis holin